MRAADGFEAWRARARELLQQGISPADADWSDGGLLPHANPTGDGDPVPLRIPAALLDLLERAACHRDPRAPALMYRVVWRVTHGRRGLLDDAGDDDVIALRRMAKAVDRASHKMKAFVRFREIEGPFGPCYVAWFEPEHRVLARTAPFFADRFATLDWTIAMPDGGARWDGHALAYFDPPAGMPLPTQDAAESLWLAYYESIFNPARFNVRQMRKEMPVGYWKNLPEARRIPMLVDDAMRRAGQMVEARVDPARTMHRRAIAVTTEVDDVPAVAATPTKAALDACARCPLGVRATQGVAGEGPDDARIVLVGEQPGDEEDLAGRPFVGPAGRLLRRAMVRAGLDARSVYLTNAVKHFGYELRGKRRIHKTPAQRDVEACRGWLDAEIERLQPRVVVALGATALHALAGRRLAVGEARGATLALASGARLVATWHPSSVLRASDASDRAERFAGLVDDLRLASAAADDR